MKGPQIRLSFDRTRTWKCSECERTQESGGHVTSLVCFCQKPFVRMQLIETVAGRTRIETASEILPSVCMLESESDES